MCDHDSTEMCDSDSPPFVHLDDGSSRDFSMIRFDSVFGGDSEQSHLLYVVSDGQGGLQVRFGCETVVVMGRGELRVFPKG